MLLCVTLCVLQLRKPRIQLLHVSGRLPQRLVKSFTIRLQSTPAFASRRCCCVRSAGRRAPLAGSAGMAAWVLDKHSNKSTKLTDEYKLGKVVSGAPDALCCARGWLVLPDTSWTPNAVLAGTHGSQNHAWNAWSFPRTPLGSSAQLSKASATTQVLGKGAFGTVYLAEDGVKQAFACKSISKAKLITEVRHGLLRQAVAGAPVLHCSIQQRFVSRLPDPHRAAQRLVFELTEPAGQCAGGFKSASRPAACSAVAAARGRRT